MAEVKEKPKGPLGKLKEAAEDKEEQLLYLATLIRVIVLVWSAGILTLNYVKIPGYDAGETIDPTFIVALGIVGLGGYVFIRKDAIIDGVKSKVMESVMPSIGGGIMESIPDMTGPAMPTMPKL